MVLESILDPVLGPLLGLDPFWTILVLSFGITSIITVAYKFLTDQDEMKRLKKKMKSYQKKMRKLQKEDPEKAMAVQKEAMEVNMKYMKHSFKPTLYTFIPIIIIFGWMNSHLAYVPLDAGVPFNVTAAMDEGLPGNVTLDSVPELLIANPSKDAGGMVTWTVEAEETGDYSLIVRYGEGEFRKNLLISDMRYSDKSEDFEGPVNKITLGMREVKPLNGFSVFGWEPGWLGTYIIFSIIISLSLRKIFNIA